MVRIEWSPSYEIGVATIDDDHQSMVSLLGLYWDAVAADDRYRCDELAAEFMASADAHFAREESILADAGYPDLADHEDFHQGLWARSAAIMGRLGKAPAVSLEACFDELVTLLLADILVGDMQFKSHLEMRGVARRF